MSENQEAKPEKKKTPRFELGKVYINLDHVMVIEVRADSQNGPMAFVTSMNERERKIKLSDLVVLQ